ncbi:MAG: 16S rRNA processing protein RimM [Wenzhouxiangella sp.]|nr:MAG: 16S rRNA processing protein RimM [Wenzhouxiangella sp.]
MSGEGAGSTVLVGRILGPWGVQGWVSVYSWTDPPEALFDYRPWLVGQEQRQVELSDWRRSGKRLLASLAGVDTPERVAELTGQDIHVPRSLLPPLEAGSYYWHDLVGLEVINLQDLCWGRIQRMLPTGAHDVMEISGGSSPNVLIPFVQPDVVRQVDLEAGRVTVDWPEDWVD